MTIAEIKSMSIAERLRAMEDLWNVLCTNEEEIQSPDWHDEILQERRKKIESGDAEFVSIKQLKESVRK